MPTYEYECTKCERVFELFQSMKDKAKKTIATDCDKCHDKAPVVRRIGTGAAVIFRGSGFYQTDYRSESYKESAKKDTEAAAPAKKEGESAGTKKEGETASTEKKDAPKTETASPSKAGESKKVADKPTKARKKSAE